MTNKYDEVVAAANEVMRMKEEVRKLQSDLRIQEEGLKGTLIDNRMFDFLNINWTKIGRMTGR